MAQNNFLRNIFFAIIIVGDLAQLSISHNRRADNIMSNDTNGSSL